MKKRAFTLIETLAGVTIGFWIVFGCYVILFFTTKNANTVFNEYNDDRETINLIFNQIEQDLSQTIGVYITPGLLLIDGYPFHETKWYMNGNGILAYDMNAVFKNLSSGYLNTGKVLTIKKDPDLFSFLIMGNENKIISYYEFKNFSGNSKKTIEIKRYIGSELTNHIKTDKMKELDFHIDRKSKTLVFNYLLELKTIQNKFLIPFIPI